MILRDANSSDLKMNIKNEQFTLRENVSWNHSSISMHVTSEVYQMNTAFRNCIIYSVVYNAFIQISRRFKIHKNINN